MFTLKPISREAIPGALAKAERYRLLNEPVQAESICLDVLAIDPKNRQALITMLLALTDQFGGAALNGSGAIARAQEILKALPTEYERAYYAGILCERRATALLGQGGPSSPSVAHDWLRDAMEWYERAEAVRPPDNDDSILRWNTCARLIMQNPRLRAAPESPREPIMSE
jgi:hypothetical protein